MKKLLKHEILFWIRITNLHVYVSTIFFPPIFYFLSTFSASSFLLRRESLNLNSKRKQKNEWKHKMFQRRSVVHSCCCWNPDHYTIILFFAVWHCMGHRMTQYIYIHIRIRCGICMCLRFQQQQTNMWNFSKSFYVTYSKRIKNE